MFLFLLSCHLTPLPVALEFSFELPSENDRSNFLALVLERPGGLRLQYLPYR